MLNRCVMLACLGLVAGLNAAAPADWPQWRGPARDGSAPSFEVPKQWPATLSRRWSAVVGAGHASPVVADGRVFVHARQGEQEVITAFDTQGGKRLWNDSYPAPYRVNTAASGHGPGPKSTPVVSGGTLCTFGISGILTCYDAASGRRLWRTQPVNEQPVYGTAMSPLIDKGALIAHVGGQERGALTAFDLTSGRVRWQWTGAAPAYASPVIGTFAGARQIVTQSRTHVVGIGPDEGRLLWQVPFTTEYDQNAVTPVLIGDVVVYSGLSNGITAIRPQRQGGSWRVEHVWKNDRAAMYMSSPVMFGSLLVGLSHRNRGQFFALDPRTGTTTWQTEGRQAENAALVAAKGALLALTTNGELVVFTSDGTELKEIKRYSVSDTATWAHPAISGRRLFVKDVENLTAWDIP
jgi:outer membrane protein assembly factor BamB